VAALALGVSLGAGELERRTVEWLKAWDAQGFHRTGTAGDEAGAAWLAREAAAIAGPVTSETFRLERIDTRAAYVEFDGERIAGETLFEAPPTGPEGVSGLAGDERGPGPIAVSPLSPSAVYSPDFAVMRGRSPHRAQVIITMGLAPGLALLNAEAFRTPFGPPAVQISSVEKDRVMAALARRAEFRVVTDYVRTRVEARNIVVTIPGRDRSRPPVVVMTPRSSWWQSTAERGGGIVCWLETLRAVKAAGPACDVVFTANSGHELGHIGLDDFVARRPDWETRATWIHYGANIGAAGSKLTILSNQDDLRALAAGHLKAAGKPPDAFGEKTVVPSGETKDIHRKGGRYLTLVAPPASSRLFHLPQDRWPDAVEVDVIGRVADGMGKAVVALTR
jgi:hypothetical protein